MSFIDGARIILEGKQDAKERVLGPDEAVQPGIIDPVADGGTEKRAEGPTRYFVEEDNLGIRPRKKPATLCQKMKLKDLATFTLQGTPT